MAGPGLLAPARRTAVLLRADDLYLDPERATCWEAEDRLDAVVDVFVRPSARLRTRELGLQLPQEFLGLRDALAARLFLLEREEAAREPEDRPALFRGQVVSKRAPAISRSILASCVFTSAGSDFPGRLVALDPLSELAILEPGTRQDGQKPSRCRSMRFMASSLQSLQSAT